MDMKKMTVKEVSTLTGVSIRTLQYYDRLGLLPPAGRTGAGYRLYDDTALERLQQILLFRELEFSLAEIKVIIDNPDFDRNKALDQQIELLTLKKQRLDRIIDLARDIRSEGEINMDFKVFDSAEIEAYAKRAKEQWGGTREYAEFEKKNAGKTPEQNKAAAEEFMKLFAEFGKLRGKPADCAEVQEQVGRVKDFICANYYQCSDEMLYSLGQMYSAEGEFKANIDRAGGEGTAEFVTKAITAYCGK